MTADASDALHVAWTDNRTGGAQLWASRITVAGTALLHGDSTLTTLEDSVETRTGHGLEDQTGDHLFVFAGAVCLAEANQRILVEGGDVCRGRLRDRIGELTGVRSRRVLRPDAIQRQHDDADKSAGATHRRAIVN